MPSKYLEQIIAQPNADAKPAAAKMIPTAKAVLEKMAETTEASITISLKSIKLVDKS
jgi:F0F1-type ATP synthase membrane subunit b/b'